MIAIDSSGSSFNHFQFHFGLFGVLRRLRAIQEYKVKEPVNIRLDADNRIFERGIGRELEILHSVLFNSRSNWFANSNQVHYNFKIISKMKRTSEEAGLPQLSNIFFKAPD